MISLHDYLKESLAKPDFLHAMRAGAEDHTWVDRTPEFLKQLAKTEWRIVGEGAGGVVFHRRGDSYIVKLFSQEDEGYKKWLMFCANNPTNSFVPRFKGKPVPINKGVAAVRMELLSQIDFEKYDDIKIWWQEYQRHISTLRRQGSSLFKNDAGVMSLEQFRLYMDDDWPTSQPTKDFIKCMAFISNHLAPDIHSGNFMERPNGEVVITDPLFRPHEKRTTKYGRGVEDFLKSRF